MNTIFKYVIVVVMLSISLGCSAQYPFPQQNYQQPQYVGIPTAQMNFVAAAQNNSQ